MYLLLSWQKEREMGLSKWNSTTWIIPSAATLEEATSGNSLLGRATLNLGHGICDTGDAVCAPEHTKWATEIKITGFTEGFGNEQLPGFCLLRVWAYASFPPFQSGIDALCRTIKWYHNRKTVAEKLPRLLLFWKHLGFWSSKPSSPELGAHHCAIPSPYRPWVSAERPCRLRAMYVGYPTDLGGIIHLLNLFMYSESSAALLS